MHPLELLHLLLLYYAINQAALHYLISYFQDPYSSMVVIYGIAGYPVSMKTVLPTFLELPIDFFLRLPFRMTRLHVFLLNQSSVGKRVEVVLKGVTFQ